MTVYEDFKSSKEENEVVASFLAFENSPGDLTGAKSTQKPITVVTEHLCQESFRTPSVAPHT